MHRGLFRLTAWILLVLFPASLTAQTAQATLQAKGPVTVNGNQVPGSTTVFAGDRIETMAGGTASLSAQGLSVVVPPQSSVIFGDRALDVGCGGAVVSTSIGQMTRVAGLTITPVSKAMTTFEVSNAGGTLRVTAREGSIRVEDGGETRELAQGQDMSRPSPSGACGPVTTTTQGTGRFFIPATIVAAVSALIAYCAVNGFCSEESPSAP